MLGSAQTAKSTLSMRKRKSALSAKGWKITNVALSPCSLDVIERVKANLNLTSREAAVNAILERIDQDMFLRQEFLTVTP